MGGTCDMKKVVDKVKLDSLAPQKQHFEMLTNCDYAIECGKKLDCKLVGIGGSDLKRVTRCSLWPLCGSSCVPTPSPFLPSSARMASPSRRPRSSSGPTTSCLRVARAPRSETLRTRPTAQLCRSSTSSTS